MIPSIFLSLILGMVLSIFIKIKTNILCVLLIDAENEIKRKYSFYQLLKESLKYESDFLKSKKTKYILSTALIISVNCFLVYLAVSTFDHPAQIILAIIFFYSLMILTLVDIRTQYLPDIITKPLIILGISLNLFDIFTSFKSSIIGALVGYWSLWIINFTFKKLRNKDGMGQGDFKLFSAIGAWIGFQYLPFTIFFSSIIGIFVAISLSIFKDKDLSSPSPFGPALAISAIIFFLYGDIINDQYISFLEGTL